MGRIKPVVCVRTKQHLSLLNSKVNYKGPVVKKHNKNFL